MGEKHPMIEQIPRSSNDLTQGQSNGSSRFVPLGFALSSSTTSINSLQSCTSSFSSFTRSLATDAGNKLVRLSHLSTYTSLVTEAQVWDRQWACHIFCSSGLRGKFHIACLSSWGAAYIFFGQLHLVPIDFKLKSNIVWEPIAHLSSCQF